MYKLVVSFIKIGEEYFQYVECDQVILDTTRRVYSVIRGTNIYEVSTTQSVIYSVIDKDTFFSYMKHLLLTEGDSHYREMELGSPISIEDRLTAMGG